MKKAGLLLLFLLCIKLTVLAQHTNVVSGIKLAEIDFSSALIIVDVTNDINELSVHCWEEGSSLKLVKKVNNLRGNRQIEVSLNELIPNRLYHYNLVLNGTEVKFGNVLRFKTKPMQVCKAGHF